MRFLRLGIGNGQTPIYFNGSQIVFTDNGTGEVLNLPLGILDFIIRIVKKTKRIGVLSGGTFRIIIVVIKPDTPTSLEVIVQNYVPPPSDGIGIRIGNIQAGSTSVYPIL
jgi:hypothetical protein